MYVLRTCLQAYSSKQRLSRIVDNIINGDELKRLTTS